MGRQYRCKCFCIAGTWRVAWSVDAAVKPVHIELSGYAIRPVYSTPPLYHALPGLLRVPAPYAAAPRAYGHAGYLPLRQGPGLSSCL